MTIQNVTTIESFAYQQQCKVYQVSKQVENQLKDELAASLQVDKKLVKLMYREVTVRVQSKRTTIRNFRTNVSNSGIALHYSHELIGQKLKRKSNPYCYKITKSNSY